jgi:ABC-2 type transport system ATP-binding protein
LAKNKTVLFSSHILQEVEAICDSVIIINKGNIVANDSLQNLKNANSRTEKIIVQFIEDVSVEDIKSLSHVQSVTQLQNQFHISSNNSIELRKAIVNLSVQKSLNIVSMQNEVENLENIFSALTNN